MKTSTTRTWIAAALTIATATGCVGDAPVPETGERENTGLDLVSFAANLGANEPDDRFGAAVASGDFDDDGFADLAVGAPGEAPGSDAKAGVVFIFKGTPIGLIPWRLLTQETKKQDENGDSIGTGLGTNGEDDRFGSALAVGDINNDSIDDLAVGAPSDRPHAQGPRVGAVYIFAGKKKSTGDDRVGLQPWARIAAFGVEGMKSRDGDNFGCALATGKFSSWVEKGQAALAIGASGWGADGKQQGAVFGVVNITDGHGPDLRLIGMVEAPDDAEHMSGFGTALATGDLNHDGRDEIAVGAPFETVQGKAKAGRVHLYDDFDYVLSLDADVLGQPTTWGFFGRAIAMGDLDGNADKVDEIAVHGNGKLFFWHGRKDANEYEPWDDNKALVPWDDLEPSQFGGNHGEYFAASLVIAQLDGAGPQDLAVGGHGVYVARGKASGPTPWKFLAASKELGADAHVGSTLAVGNFDGKDGNDILAGAPGHEESSGAVERWTRDGSALEAAQVITQETTGP